MSSENPRGTPLFVFLRYNPRRAARGAEAAELEVTWPDGDSVNLWMSKVNLMDNILLHGHQSELLKALEHCCHHPSIPYDRESTQSTTNEQTP